MTMTRRETEKAWGLAPDGGTNMPSDPNDYANLVAPEWGGMHSGSPEVRKKIKAEQAMEIAQNESAK